MLMKRCLAALLLLSVFWVGPAVAENDLRAGAAAVDISPRALPAIRNGGFIQAQWDRVDDPLHARCLVLSAGNETIAIAIVDSCMFPTDICDAIKSRVTKQIGLPPNRILISATHTHSAPSVMSYCLGSGRDEAYVEYVVPRVADAIVAAHEKTATCEDRLDVRRCSRANQLPPLDHPKRSYGYRSFWRANGASDDASGLSEPRICQSGWSD